VDFCYPARGLIVEIDGPIHQSQRHHDAERQRLLEMRGYRILRISGAKVETRMAAALRRITEALDISTEQG
jgi:very-short-patch-repair endonuclease